MRSAFPRRTLARLSLLCCIPWGVARGQAALAIERVLPDHGPLCGGVTIEVRGTEFPADASVRIGGKVAIATTVLSATSIRALAPPGLPGSAPVAVESSAGSATIASGFHYLAFGADYATASGPALLESRAGAAVVALLDGRTLLVGGFAASGGAALATAEVYDSALHAFVPTATPMAEPRAFFFASLLPSGKVLIAGGVKAGGGVVLPSQPLSSAEVFDPATMQFQLLSSTLIPPRWFGETTLLADGRVWLAGGMESPSGTPTDITSFFSEASLSFSPGPFLPTRLFGQAQVVLGSGDVLVAGGAQFWGACPTMSSAAAWLFAPASGSWTSLPPLPGPRHHSRAILLPSGKVGILGGLTGDCAPYPTVGRIDVFDPAALSFSTCSAILPHPGGMLGLRADGRIVSIGGQAAVATSPVPASNEVAVFDPDACTVAIVGSVPQPLAGGAAVVRSRTGGLVIAGGVAESTIGKVTPATAASHELPPRPQFLTFSSGCPGSASAPSIGATGLPVLGNPSFALTLQGGSPGGVALLALGASNVAWAALPLPFDLTPFGGPGCKLLVAADLVRVAPIAGDGSAGVPMPIPASVSLAGAEHFAQWITASSLGSIAASAEALLVVE